MNTAACYFQKTQRATGLIGLGALLTGALFAWRFPNAFAPAWRCAVFIWAGPAFGSLLFALIYQMTGGSWGESLRPFLISGTRLLPWVWLLVVPLLFDSMRKSTVGDWWRYVTPAAFVLRAIIYGVVFFLLAGATRRALQRGKPPGYFAWVGPLGIIVVLFMNHLLVDDWLAGLDPQWRSTAFPLVWLTGQAVAGVAMALLMGLLADVNPALSFGYHRTLGIDWGTLLFATAMFWCYVAFSQFLIVWSGNLPGETGWFSRRLAGAWRFLPLMLAVLHFVVPLVVLLSRRAKQNRRMLAVVAGLLLAAQSLHTAWMILPAFPQAMPAASWLALIFTIGIGGLFANRSLALARKEIDA